MSGKSQKTILLVEDEAIIALGEKKTLEEYGYKVITVYSGEKAVETVNRTVGIDLILMDINLGTGKMDGTKAAEMILRHRDLPVVFLSSHVEPEIVTKTEKITSYGYIVKNSGSTVLDASIKMAFKLFEAKTEEKAKEEALARSRDLLVNLARLVPGVIYQYRLYPDGRSAFPYSSPGMNDIYEVTPEDVREDAAPVFGRLHPDDYVRVADSIQESARTLKTFYCEFRVNLPRQGLRWRWSQAHPERMEDGGTLWHGIISDITERKQAEEALRNAEIRYRLLFEQSPDGIVIIDQTTAKVLEFNKTAYQQLGYSREEFARMSISDIDVVETPEEIRTHIARVADHGLDDFETLHRTRLGEIRNVHVTAQCTDVDGRPIYHCIWRDITERKKAEKLQDAIFRIAQAADRAGSLESLYPAIHAIIQEVMTAENFYIALYNEKTDLLSFPFSVDKFDPVFPPQKPGLGLTAYVLRSGKSVLCDEALFQELLRRGKIELIGAHSPIWLGVPLIIEGKTIGVMAVQSYEDPRTYGERERRILEFVSSQVAMAIHGKQTEEALRREKYFAESLVQTAQAVILVLDMTGRIVSFNPTLERISGYSLAELKGKDLVSAFIPERNRNQAQEMLLDSLAGRPTRGNVVEIIAKDGHRIDIEWFAKTLHDEAGNTIGWLASGQDITARKRVEDESQALLREKEILLKEVHHRIKNNMHAMMSLLSMQADSLPDPEAKAALQKARDRLRSMGLLYDKLYRSENLEKMSLRDYLSPLVDEIVAVFPNRERVKIEKKIEDIVLEVKVLSPLGIAVNELITNAMKHAFTGRKDGLISVSATAADHHVTLIIEDNGNGIPESVSLEDSHGLGFGLVGILTAQIDGTIRIDRRKGARFVLEFDV